MANDETTVIKSLKSVELPMEPACIEYCPAHPNHLVIGFWHLVKEESQLAGGDQDSGVVEKQKHRGRIDLYLVEGKDVQLVQTQEQPHWAIWDLQFQVVDGYRDVLAAGSSAGTVLVLKVCSGASAGGPLQQVSCIGPISKHEKVMVTKCCWHPRISNLLAISTLAGEVHLMQLRGDDFSVAAMTTVPVTTHSEPAWTVALSPQVGAAAADDDDNDEEEDAVFTVYSGGDDAALRYTSVRLHQAEEQQKGSSFERLFEPVRKSWHMAGVVSILPLPITLSSDGSHVVVTGSYDDSLRVCAIRPLHETSGVAAARVLAEKHLGGGAWRLKVVGMRTGADGKSWSVRILAPCMSAGSRILDISGPDDAGNWHIEVAASWLEEGENNMLNYASDAQVPGRGANNDEEGLAGVSTSFYSKMLYIWEL